MADANDTIVKHIHAVEIPIPESIPATRGIYNLRKPPCSDFVVPSYILLE